MRAIIWLLTFIGIFACGLAVAGLTVIALSPGQVSGFAVSVYPAMLLIGCLWCLCVGAYLLPTRADRHQSSVAMTAAGEI